MAGKIIGYVRVSSVDQNPARQLENVPLDRVFIDYGSGKTPQRPQLQALLQYIREDDTLIVHSLDRLARNLMELKQIITQLTQQNITVRFIHEQLTFTRADSPMANLLLAVMGAFAEFEHALIRERQREGIALAKQNKVYKGRQPCLNHAQVQQLKTEFSAGMNKAALATKFNLSRPSVYKYLAQQ